MKSHAIFAAVALAICAASAGAQAAAVVHLIPVTGAQDMVFDAPREMIYITSGTQVLRFDVATAKFLSPITLGGNLEGIDLSPDGMTLAVADATSTQANSELTVWVHLVSLPSLVDNEQTFNQQPLSDGAGGGTWAVAYARNGDLVVTEGLIGCCGQIDNWYYTALKKQWAEFPWMEGNYSMTTVSGNGSHFDFAGNATEDPTGYWSTFNALDKKSSETSSLGTTLPRDIAGNAGNSQIALITSNNDVLVYTNGVNSGGSILALDGAYDLIRPIAYFTQPNSSFVISYNMSTLAQRAVYDFNTTFTGGSFVTSFGGGRTRISLDGSLLMAIGNDGVHYLQLYAPLKAANVPATTPAGQSVQLTAAGSIGIDAVIKYLLPPLPARQPAHGTATISGNVVTYVPATGFTGTDAFTYQAQYGRAFEDATMTVTVQ